MFIRILIGVGIFLVVSLIGAITQIAGCRKQLTYRNFIVEYSNVFKFHEESDVMFNSSLLYEMNALRPFAEACLQKVQEDSPHFATKERLLNLLSFFEPLDIAKVPFNSILREFIGEGLYDHCKL